MGSALEQVRADQQDAVRTDNYKNLEALSQKEFRQEQLQLLKEFLF